MICVSASVGTAQCYRNAKRLLHTRRNVTLRRVAFISPNPIESSPKITGNLSDNGLENIYNALDHHPAHLTATVDGASFCKM